MADEMESTMQSSELIAYRLGRVEKAVDSINMHSIERDDKILQKLEQITELAHKVSEHSFRISSLEASRTNIYRFLTAIGTAVALMVIQKIFDLF